MQAFKLSPEVPEAGRPWLDSLRMEDREEPEEPIEDPEETGCSS